MPTEWFNNLAPDVQYTLMAAMRGPDVDDGPMFTVKGIVTNRLRHIVWYNTPGLSWAKNGEPAMTNEELETVRAARLTALQQSIPGAGHYFSHLHSAIRECADNPIWGGLGQDLYDLT